MPPHRQGAACLPKARTIEVTPTQLTKSRFAMKVETERIDKNVVNETMRENNDDAGGAGRI